MNIRNAMLGYVQFHVLDTYYHTKRNFSKVFEYVIFAII